MIVKKLSDLKNTDVWDLSEHEDIIITKDNTDTKRVLVNYDSYKILKDASEQCKQSKFKVQDADQFDLNPYLEELIKIVKDGQFEDITDQPHYFENLARQIKSTE